MMGWPKTSVYDEDAHCYGALHLFQEMADLKSHIIAVCIFIIFGHAHYFL